MNIRVFTKDYGINVHAHAAQSQGADYTLCGLTLDEDGKLIEKPNEPTKDKIDCPTCINIINHCKRIRL